jgi:hypothetical protein
MDANTWFRRVMLPSIGFCAMGGLIAGALVGYDVYSSLHVAPSKAWRGIRGIALLGMAGGAFISWGGTWLVWMVKKMRED